MLSFTTTHTHTHYELHEKQRQTNAHFLQVTVSPAELPVMVI